MRAHSPFSLFVSVRKFAGGCAGNSFAAVECCHLLTIDSDDDPFDTGGITTGRIRGYYFQVGFGGFKLPAGGFGEKSREAYFRTAGIQRHFFAEAAGPFGEILLP